MSPRLVCALFPILLAGCALRPVEGPARPAAADPAASGARPNVVLIYADDLGWGDVGAYGATQVPTPNLDRLAAEGLRLTNAHATAATCTPSRYSLLTGEYAWRRPGTGIAPGDAGAIIPPGRPTLASVVGAAGYATGVVGKWHLGLGPEGGPDWNGHVAPGPLEIGFDEAFLIPATGDRVPTVYVEDHRVVGLDPADPIAVSFDAPLGDEPTGRENPELLRVQPSHWHDMAIVNGISRIGYMTGGEAARWVDEDMADTLSARAVDFVERHRDGPFFLYYPTHDVHVPRAPHPRFVGATDMGPRGDAIVQLDWAVGEVLAALDRLGIADETLVVFTSDNGPVLDDGYRDGAAERVGDHRPAGPFRGGKYSAFEAGTRVPFLVRWPGHVPPGAVSDALVSQVDLFASLAALADAPLPADAAPDSRDERAALLGRSEVGRAHAVGQALGGTLSLVRGPWKYIEPSDGPRVNQSTGIELGNRPGPQLYRLADDPGERRNVAAEHPDVLAELQTLLAEIRAAPDAPVRR